MIPVILLETSTTRIISSAKLNGVPLSLGKPLEPLEANEQVNEWAKTGKNVLELEVQWPADKDFLPGIAKAHASVRIIPHGMAASDVEPAVELRWPGVQPEGYPARLRGEFVLKDFPMLRLWSDCAVVNGLESPEREGLIRITQELHAAYAKGDPEKICALSPLKIEDIAAGYGEGAADRRAAMQNLVKRMAGESGWGMEPFSPEGLEFELVAENRLIWITRPGGRPVLVSKPTKTFEWSTHLYLGRVKGEWSVVR